MSDAGEIELEGYHLFRMRLLDDMFRKLHRELGYFRKARGDRKASTDHAINFCITAWHLTDWIWLRHAADLRGERFGENLQDFQLAVKRESVEMAVCDVVANAAKHGGRAHAKPDRPDVMTILVAPPIPEGVTAVEFVTSGSERPMKLRISINGKPRPAEAVFELASSYLWRLKMNHLRPLATIKNVSNN